ncbi:MAG: archease [Spirochaetales bacterium]|nr:archease [Spirochaetales bacterium]
MPFDYLEDLSAADVAFRAEGGTLAELFAAAWEATLGVMIDLTAASGDTLAPPAVLRRRARRRIRLQEPEPDRLLHAFLEEQLYFKDAEGLLLRLMSCRVERRGGGRGTQGAEHWRVRAVAAGERADPTRHRLGTDVKAVTWHRFTLRREGETWRATVILDV